MRSVVRAALPNAPTDPLSAQSGGREEVTLSNIKIRSDALDTLDRKGGRLRARMHQVRINRSLSFCRTSSCRKRTRWASTQTRFERPATDAAKQAITTTGSQRKAGGSRTVQACGSAAVMSPSTTNSPPHKSVDSSLARDTISEETSSGCGGQPRGTCWPVESSCSATDFSRSRLANLKAT